MRTKLIIMCVICWGLLCQAQSYDFRRDFINLEIQWNSGQIDIVTDTLLRLRPVNDEERAFVNYYSALVKNNTSEIKNLLSNNAERYQTSIYGQRSLLELAKIYLLEHNLTESNSILRQITSPELPERHYWLGLTAFQSDNFADALSFFDTFTRITANSPLLEHAYYLLAESQIKLNRYQNAIVTLNKLKNTDSLPSDNQYYYYQLAFAHELAGSYNDAVSHYKQAYEINKYSQIAYLIEDRLFLLRSRLGSRIDISFLYPYTDLTPPIIGDSLSTSQSNNTNNVSNRPNLSSVPLKISSRPNTGIYLQSGRFSVESNALSRAGSIVNLNLPAVYFEETQNGRLTWVVMCGPFTSSSLADSAREKLSTSNIDSFVVRY